MWGKGPLLPNTGEPWQAEGAGLPGLHRCPGGFARHWRGRATDDCATGPTRCRGRTGKRALGPDFRVAPHPVEQHGLLHWPSNARSRGLVLVLVAVHNSVDPWFLAVGG